MIKLSVIHKSVITGLLLFFGTLLHVSAATEPYQHTLQGKIKKGDTLIVKDEKFRNEAFNWSLIRNKTVDNVITFGFYRDTAGLPQKSFKCKLDLKVEYWSQPDQIDPITEDHVILEIGYDTAAGAIYQAERAYRFKNGHRVKITVNDITSAELGDELPPVFKLTNMVTIDRRYDRDPNSTSKIQLTVTPTPSENTGNIALRSVINPPVEAGGEVLVNWTVDLPTEEFDLDWTFIDEESVFGEQLSAPGGTANHEMFRNNFTRVTVSAAQEYPITLVHQSKFLLIRIRGVRQAANGLRDEDQEWSDIYVHPLNNPWHQTNKNWQYSASFAEEGKKKEVISYADGALRNRQSVTVANPGASASEGSQKFAVVQETVYDEFGRPAMSILPAPIKSKEIKYYPGLNLNANLQPYNFTNMYGTSPGSPDKPDPLSTTGGGASTYYSANNPFLADDIRFKFVPNANGYPFSVTRYTPDNTGRVSVQGGVGEIFQPGSNGKATLFFYGKPEAWELDRLFGNDVGYAHHYQKKMTVDPNGQVAIAYEDASGKTIATALTGAAPANLMPLGSQPVVAAKTTPLLIPSQFRFDPTKLTLTATANYMVSLPNQSFKVDYVVEQLISRYSSALSGNICSNCYYSLKITVSDDDGNIQTVIAQPAVIGSMLSNCDLEQPKVESFNYTPAKIGTYYIRFELGMSEDVIGTYTDDFIKRNKDLKTEFQFLLEQLNRMDFKNCISDCQTCLGTLGEKANFMTRVREQLLLNQIDVVTYRTQIDAWSDGMYDVLFAYCQNIRLTCSQSPCDEYKTLMLADVSPGGQYALFMADGTALEPTLNVISKYWRSEVFIPSGPADPNYQATLIKKDDGSFTSPYDANFSIVDLIKYWDPAWANLFLQYHPERCALTFCEDNAQYIRWDQRLKQEIQTAAQLTSLQPGLQYLRDQADWLVNADPYFQSGGNGFADAATFRQALLNYSQKYPNQFPTVKSLTQYVDYVLYCADPFGSTNTSSNEDKWVNCTPDVNCRVIDREWELYRDKYLQLKEEFYQNKRNGEGGECANKCIPGKLVSVENICPDPASFSFYQEGATSGGMKTLKVKFEGNMQWAAFKLYLTLPAEYASAGNEKIVNPKTFTWSVPEGLQLNDIVINRAECIPLSAGDLPCNGNAGVINLSSANGKKTGEFSFTDLVGGSTTTYHIVKGYSDDQPILTDYCAGATAVYYNCLQVKIGANPYQFFNVWVVTCTNIAGRSMNMNMPLNSVAAMDSETCGYEYGHFDVTTESAGPDNFRVKIYSRAVPANTDNILLSVVYLVQFQGGSEQEVFTFHMPLEQNTVKYGGTYNNNGTLGQFINITYLSMECEVIPPGGDPCDPLLVNKTPRFTTIAPNASADADLNQLNTQALAGIQSQIDVNCEENAETWLLQMEDCLREKTTLLTYSAKRTALKEGFIAVCKLGGDPDHIYGASTAPPGKSTTVGGYTSFGDVIQQVLNVPAYTMECNPWLIDGPYPYKAKMQGTTTVIGNTNTAICEKLGKLIEDHSINGAGQSFYQFVKNRFGDGVNVTEAELAMLVKGCTNCRYLLEKPVELPVFLDPGAKGCISFQEYNNAKSAFNAALGGALNLSNENYERMLATYMNHQWGFTMGYDQYKAYEDLLAVQPSAGLCNQPAFAGKVNDDPLVCLMGLVNDAAQQAKYMYAKYIEDERRKFRKKYVEVCGNTKARATLIAPQQIYHYTLYYYNQAGQLIRTVPPEGVNPLSDADVAKVQEARSGTIQACGTYAGPGVEANKETVANDLGHVINNGPGALEFWLRNTGFGPMQVLHTSNGTKKYMFNTCLNGNFLNVDVYELVPGGNEVSVILTHHTAVNVQGALPLKEWTHIVMQASNLLTDNLQIYVNGVSCPAAPEAPASSCGFDLAVGSGGVVYPENYTAVRHLRTYTSVLSAVNVGRLYANTCMIADGAENPGNLRYSWAQFNVPPAEPGGGGPTSGIAVNGVYPDHKMTTNYAYNTLGQVVKQKTPDAGISNFWYDYLGRLVLSQNAEQLAPVQEDAIANRYSYTKYERLGRIEEVGEVLNLGALPAAPFLPLWQSDGLINAGTRQQITKTYYDVKPSELSSQPLENLRKRVAASMYLENSSAVPDQMTYYSYDAIGNVKTLWQKINGLDVKRMDYDYDLASGKVNMVRYQLPENNDRFMYEYKYDAENRLVKVNNGFMNGGWAMQSSKTQAAYVYYPHGPLARMELGGENDIQGVDYAYTLQGWLKGMNGNFLNKDDDMGRDGSSLTGGKPFAPDAMAYSLNYFDGDFRAIAAPTAFALEYQRPATYDGKQLFNGNIAGAILALSERGSGAPVGYTYVYDQLNRLKHMRQQNITSTTWVPRANPDDSPFMEDISYDGNGNILKYIRNGSGVGKPLGMDNLTYAYETIAGEKTNRLASVKDDFPVGGGTSEYENDLEGLRSYSYDKIGNLIAETATDKIFWTAYGKISKVLKNNQRFLEYKYDVGGNRVSKAYYRDGPTSNPIITWYVRDAQGNTLATYEKDQSGVITWKEQHLYGSSRLGLWEPQMNIAENKVDEKWMGEGSRVYELTNHLGNVISVLSDKKLGTPTNRTLDVISMQDYYPFGMPMEGRYGLIAGTGPGMKSGYRYGFNGKENDNEVKGEGSQQDYGMRIYDAKVGRFLSVDPITKMYPELTPYQFASNTPIMAIDIDGNEAFVKTNWYDKESKLYRTVFEFDESAAKLQGDLIHEVNNFALPDRRGSISQTSTANFSPLDFLKQDAPYMNLNFNGEYEPIKGNYPVYDSKSSGQSLMAKFVMGTGSENSVVYGGKIIDDLKASESVKSLKLAAFQNFYQDGKLNAGESFSTFYHMEKGKDGVEIWAKAISQILPGPFQEPPDENEALSIRHFMGSYAFNAFVLDDGKTIVYTLSDSKTLESLTDHQFGDNSINRNGGRTPFGTTYQKYIWTEQANMNFIEILKPTSNSNK
ncbi:RHS repeat-associated core domain-containing protein [Chitinophaga niabensis]|uniref:RHS repeat-associated core domain-containing protein n=1 Tax=Chitinophaga niabensis TaxID=536979 RepID=UPI0031BB03C8